MSRLVGKFKGGRSVEALLVCAIIVCSAIIIAPYLLPRAPSEITLRILTYDDVAITSMIEEQFLNSTYAEEYNIADIEWVGFTSLLIGSGTIDVIMGPSEIISDLGQSGFLSPISRDVVHQINETIAGVPLMGYDERQTIWCGYSMHVTNFELIVNETMLLENGITIPDTFEDLLSPQYSQYGLNASLIGMDFPERYSMGHIFQHLITNSLGWENGIQNLTALYANSRFYMNEGYAEYALLNGEIAVTLTTFTGQQHLWHEWLPPSLSRRHLENQVIVTPDLVGIDNSSEYKDESEAFIEFLLSSEGQSVFLLSESGRLPVRFEAFNHVAGIYYDSIREEFIWTSRAEGFGVSEIISQESITLGVYMESTALLTHSNLTNTWRSIIMAYENGSIDEFQFNHFRKRLGESITIIDPISHVNENFTREYAQRVFNDLYNVEYAIEVIHLWWTAANQRYETILQDLSLLI